MDEKKGFYCIQTEIRPQNSSAGLFFKLCCHARQDYIEIFESRNENEIERYYFQMKKKVTLKEITTEFVFHAAI